MFLQNILSIFLFSYYLLNPIYAGTFNSKGDIKTIDINRLKKHLAGSSKGTMVAFYAPWCGHCRNLAPEYDKAATNVNNLVTFVAIDCDDKQNSASCQSDYQVRGYPTIVYFSGLPIPKSYDGPRKAKEMVDFALKHMPNFSKKIKDFNELTKIVSKSSPSRPSAVLFSVSAEVSPLYKALSSVLHKKFDVYFVPPTINTDTIAEAYDIKNRPKLIVFKGTQESDRIPYDGKMNYKSLFEFFKSNSPSQQQENIEKDETTRKASGEL